jgi:hypothetical protein
MEYFVINKISFLNIVQQIEFKKFLKGKDDGLQFTLRNFEFSEHSGEEVQNLNFWKFC